MILKFFLKSLAPGGRLCKNGIQKFSTESSKSKPKIQEKGSTSQQQTFGQPTHITHSYLLKKGEILPGIKLDELKSRRNKLMEKISTDGVALKNPDCPQIVLIPSSSTLYMSDKIPYVFRQNTDFLYFSGCQEPDSILMLIAKGGSFTSTLFLRKKDAHSELWDGPRTGVEAAPMLFGVDQALPCMEFERFLISFLNEHKKSVVWYDNAESVQPAFHKKLCQLLKVSDSQPLVSPKTIFHQLRVIKSPAEIELMQRSCDIASEAIAKTIGSSRSGITEHQLSSIVEFECKMKGASFLAYPPVVASGNNANVIHYITNNQITKDGDMVLMDAGCEYHGYSSDITRTWPINGKFNDRQRVLYEIVLEVQKELIDRLKEMPTLDNLFNQMCLLLGKRLQEVSLIPKDFQGDRLSAAAFKYCPHHVSHYLGMDVHDTSKVSRDVQVRPNMIVTVEPGIYVSERNPLALKEFQGLGIRIEDDVLIRDEEVTVLTRNCPKEVDEVEKIAQRSQR